MRIRRLLRDYVGPKHAVDNPHGVEYRLMRRIRLAGLMPDNFRRRLTEQAAVRHDQTDVGGVGAQNRSSGSLVSDLS